MPQTQPHRRFQWGGSPHVSCPTYDCYPPPMGRQHGRCPVTGRQGVELLGASENQSPHALDRPGKTQGAETEPDRPASRCCGSISVCANALATPAPVALSSTASLRTARDAPRQHQDTRRRYRPPQSGRAPGAALSSITSCLIPCGARPGVSPSRREERLLLEQQGSGPHSAHSPQPHGSPARRRPAARPESGGRGE